MMIAKRDEPGPPPCQNDNRHPGARKWSTTQLRTAIVRPARGSADRWREGLSVDEGVLSRSRWLTSRRTTVPGQGCFAYHLGEEPEVHMDARTG